MKKLNIRLLKRNHELYKKFKIQERLNLCLIREEDNAFRRNMRAVNFIDEKLKWNENAICKSNMLEWHLKEIRKILTMYEEDNVLAEVNRRDND